MSDSETILSEADRSRASLKVPKAAFNSLLKLVNKRAWLEHKSHQTLELWNACDTQEQQSLLEDLLHNFSYITSAEMAEGCSAIRDKIITEWQVDPSKTKIIATAGGNDADGSQMMLQFLKGAFAGNDDWNESNFINTIGQGMNGVKDGDAVILTDDFVGTGKTAKRKLNWMKTELAKRAVSNVSFYFVALAAMNASETEVRSTGATFYPHKSLSRGISDFYAGEKLKKAKQSMIALEDKLSVHWKGKPIADYAFGYGRSEALYAQEGANIPNNAFPLFWWPLTRANEKRTTLFRRINP